MIDVIDHGIVLSRNERPPILRLEIGAPKS